MIHGSMRGPRARTGDRRRVRDSRAPKAARRFRFASPGPGRVRYGALTSGRAGGETLFCRRLTEAAELLDEPVARPRPGCALRGEGAVPCASCPHLAGAEGDLSRV